MTSDTPALPRMTRAAMWLGTAMALGGAQACERNGPQPAPMNTPPPPNPPEPQAVQAIYGAPPPPQPAVNDSGGEAPDVALPSMLGLGATRYGAPPLFDDLV